MRVLSGNHELDCQSCATNDVFDVFVEPPLETSDARTFSVSDCEMVHTRTLHDTMIKGMSELLNLVGQGSLDLLEVCAPWDSPLTKAVRDHGGRAYALGIHNGFDLGTTKGFRAAVEVVRKTKPRYLHVSPPCFPWTAFSNCNQKTEEQVLRLQQQRKFSRRLLRNCRRLLEIQLIELNGDVGLIPGSGPYHGGGEHPLNAQSWKTPDMSKMVKLCGERFIVHGCRHGMCSNDHKDLLKKPWGGFSTHKGIRSALALKCNHGPHAHRTIQGSLTSATAVYPPLLCRRFAKALMQDLVDLFPVFAQCENENTSDEEFCCDHAILAEHEAEGVEEDHLPARAEHPLAPIPEEPEGQDEPASGGHDENADEHEPVVNPALKQMVRDAHRNLGHPGKDAFVKLLRNAGAKEEVIKIAMDYDCPQCLQRGRRSLVRQGIVPRVHEKWQCVSIDTFWWKTPKEALKAGEKPQYCIGLSMMDEATDYHCATIVKTSSEPLRNISGDDFKALRLKKLGCKLFLLPLS